MGKITMVTLECPKQGKREFEITHAERLLAMPINGGWVLADDKYEYKDGNICRRTKEKHTGGEE